MNRDAINGLAASLVGKPYLAGAEGPDFYDCYGLVRVMVRAMHGIDMMEVSREVGSLTEARKLFQQHAGAHGWRGTEHPVHGSVFLAGTKGRAAHCGVCLRDGSGYGVLHAIDDMDRSRGIAGRVVFEPTGALHARGMVWVTYWTPPPGPTECELTNTAPDRLSPPTR